MPRLQIYDPGERRLVGAADRALGAAALFRRRGRRPAAPARLLLLRLERIGDLLMALPAVADARAAAPDAEIDLVVGSWNASLAAAVPGVTRVETLDAGWLARDGSGLGVPALLQRARHWRRRHYDVVINFEPDIRSNLLAAAAGGGWTAGYRSGGGGPLLDQALDYEPQHHTTDNARRLVAAVLGGEPQGGPVATLAPPAEAIAAASRLLAGARPGPLVGLHASGGRAIKQWDPSRFAAVARALAADGATIVLTGAPGDRPLVDEVARMLAPHQRVDAAGEVDLIVLAALLQRLDLLITGDTGPMHLAHAVGTPVVAVFGPSDPARYAPRGPLDQIVRIDLPCAPCNRIRRPPARCLGHTPDCLAGIGADRVLEAARTVLGAARTPAGGDLASAPSGVDPARTPAGVPPA